MKELDDEDETGGEAEEGQHEEDEAEPEVGHVLGVEEETALLFRHVKLRQHVRCVCVCVCVFVNVVLSAPVLSQNAKGGPRG